ncbi:hypothetical protein STIAU_6707 [Stigmatella aurantiaca DW4/3-1]|nr:hypothetical protein STIAU_6707 [Stigmatella aurantiaca DW4/3-1]
MAQVMGWSQDEKRFALRLYVRVQRPGQEGQTAPEACEGYVTPEGNPFHGSLSLLAYEGTRLLAQMPIQDAGACTPLSEAQKRLDAATKRLETLGIRLGNPSNELFFSGSGSLRVQEGLQAPYSLEYIERILPQAPEPKSGMQRGTLEQEVYVIKAEARKKVLSRRSAYAYATGAAGYWRPGTDRVFVSPSGKTLVVMGAERVGNLSGGHRSLRLLGVLSWLGETLKPY